MLIGILTVVLFYMGTGMKRGVQSLVKVTADQVGNQQNSDQDFDNPQQGYMVSSLSNVQEYDQRQVTETGYIPKTGNAVYVTNEGYNEATYSSSNTVTNAGFIPGSQ